MKPKKTPEGREPDGDAGLWDRVKRTVEPLRTDQRALYSQALADFLETGGPIEPPVRRVKPASGALHHHPPGMRQTHTPPPAKPVRHPPYVPTGSAKASRGPADPPLVDLDRRTRNRIARGRTPIDGRIDLHGMRQHEAQDVLRNFIWRAHASGHRTVLVITGKGTRQRDPHPLAPPWAMGAGILRKVVPGWLAAPEMRGAVLSVEYAHASHGGEGALYVRLRARKDGP